MRSFFNYFPYFYTYRDFKSKFGDVKYMPKRSQYIKNKRFKNVK